MEVTTWGYGFGPMVAGDFEDTLSDAVGEEYSEEWSGQVGIGYLYTDLVGEAEVNDTNYTFVYTMADDGEVVEDAEPITGAGDSATAVDGWYRSSGFFGYGWGE